MFRAVREAWTGGRDSALHASQSALLQSLVRQPLVAARDVLNSVDTGTKGGSGQTVVLAHGFGSGLGFFFSSFDPLMKSKSVDRVLAFDWLGMGGSERKDCKSSPRLGLFPCPNSRFTPAQAVDFFIDPLETWLQARKLKDITLVGHSLGGYLSARYALKYPGRVKRLILASPVGFPEPFKDALKRSEMPGGLQVIDSLWSANFTPQQLVRMMGQNRGQRAIHRVLRARVQNLTSQQAEYLSSYLYQITVAKASGEYALNSILAPVSSSTRDIGVFAHEPLSTLDWTLLGDQLEQVKVLFGDHDWMRPNEPSARQVMRRINNGRINADVDIVPAAGHHLYIDNIDAFHSHIL